MDKTERPSKTIFSAEHVEKLRQSRIGKKHSEETKAKMRESQAKRFARMKKTVLAEGVS